MLSLAEKQVTAPLGNGLDGGLTDRLPVGEFRRRLLRWFRRQQRPLPWRRDADPYRVWVSEIMLQQTRVAAVSERYRDFLRRFPAVQKLARARLASVLAAWSGLGYYRRARALHKAARQIVRAGRFPETAEEWQKLPGVGRYTAAAVASIAFHQPCAAVDGNVRRVLQRLLARGDHAPERRKGVEHYWQIAQKLLSRAHPGDFNQAMMELGATICLPATPQCERCPVARWCGSRARTGTAAGRRKQAVRVQQEIAYVLLTNSRDIYLVQRPPAAPLMPGMWELPKANGSSGDAVLLRLRHAITTTDYRVTILKGGSADASGGKWVGPEQASRLPLTGLARKVLRRFDII